MRIITQKEWIGLRCGKIGSSDSCAAVGLDKGKSQLALWAEKTGRISAPDLSRVEEVQMGHRIEDFICRLAMEECHLQEAIDADMPEIVALVEQEYSEYKQPFLVAVDRPWQSASIDRLVYDSDLRIGVIEAKNRGEYTSKEWEEGEIPAQVMCQCLHIFAVAPDIEFVIVAILLGGNKFRHRKLERSDYKTEIEEVIKLEEHFMGYIERDESPQADASESSSRALKLLHPNDSGASISLGDEFTQMAEELTILKQEVKSREIRINEIQNLVVQRLGDATFGVLNSGGVFSYKTQERVIPPCLVEKRSSFRVLRFKR